MANWQTPSRLATGSSQVSSQNFINGVTKKPKVPERTYTSRPRPEVGQDPSLGPALGVPTVPNRGNVWSRNQTMPGKDPALNGLAQAQQSVTPPAGRTIFGMDSNKFARFAGSMGAAIAPGTGGGRLGAAVAGIAQDNIEKDYDSQERRERRDFLDRDREDSQSHALAADTARQDREDTRSGETQKSYDNRLDKNIAAKQTAAELLVNENIKLAKLKNSLAVAKTSADRTYLEGKVTEQNKRVDKLKKEDRVYKEKMLRTKENIALYDSLMHPPLDEYGNPKRPALTSEAAMAEVLMRQRMIKEGLMGEESTAKGSLANTGTSKKSKREGRMDPYTTKVPNRATGKQPKQSTSDSKKPSIDWGERLKPMKSINDGLQKFLKPIGDKMTDNIRRRQGL